MSNGESETNEVEEAILEVFNEAVSGEEEEDAIKLKMIGAGATFKNVTRLYNQFMIDAGLAISASDRKQIVADTLEGLDFESEEDFGIASEALFKAVQGATERSASAMVRAYAKKLEMPCFKAPTGDGTPRNPFVTLFHEALINDPDMTEQDLRDLIASLDEDYQVNPNRWFNQHNNIRKTVNKVAERCAA